MLDPPSVAIEMTTVNLMTLEPFFGQNSLEACDEAIKKYEHFIDQMATNDEKINTVLSFANRLCDENHYAADKINKKAENIDER